MNKIIKDQVKLRPLVMGDQSSLARYLNNYNIWKNVRDLLPHPYYEEDAISFIEMNQKTSPAQNLGIEIHGEVAGVIGIVLKEDVYRMNAEIGYWLGEPFWGQGVMTEAVRSMCDYAFSHFNITRLYAGVFESNTSSMRVLEKAGFRKEAVLKDTIIKANKVMDEHVYSLLKTQMPQQSQ